MGAAGLLKKASGGAPDLRTNGICPQIVQGGRLRPTNSFHGRAFSTALQPPVFDFAPSTILRPAALDGAGRVSVLKRSLSLDSGVSTV